MKEVVETYVLNAFDKDQIDTMFSLKQQWYEYNFKEFLPLDKNSKILDIGPGLGEFLRTLGEWDYHNCEGLDISKSVVDYCIKNGLKCSLTESTENWLKEHQNTFDLITLFDVLEHLPKNQLVGFVTACKRALTPEGRLIIEVPNLQAPEGYLHRYNDITHEIGFVEHTLEQILQVCGFINYKFYPFEEYTEELETILQQKKIRAFGWRLTTILRNINHNLQPQILTPEFFVVVCNANYAFSFPKTKVLLNQKILSIEDMEFICHKYDIKFEILDAFKVLQQKFKRLEERDDILQRQISELVEYNVSKGSGKRYSLSAITMRISKFLLKKK